MKFWHIMVAVLALQLSIGFINSLNLTSTDYMTLPEGSSFEITDFEGSANNSTMDESYLSVTGPLAGLGTLKDLAWGCFHVYPTLVTIFYVPASIAVIIEAIITLSWVMFIVQIITRQSWGGFEG